MPPNCGVVSPTISVRPTFALAAIPSSLFFNVVVKFFSDNPPSPTLYSVLVSVDAILNTPVDGSVIVTLFPL